MQKGPVVGSAWKDNKILTVLWTTSQPAATGTVLRRQQDGTRVSVTFMGGVDRGDQLRGYYLCRTKSRKFYKYIFYFLFDVAITNAKQAFPSLPLRTFACNWQRSSLAATVPDKCLEDQVELFILSSCNTSPSRSALR